MGPTPYQYLPLWPAANADILALSALVPGERFTRIGAPGVVYVKDTHTWARLNWKGRTSHAPMHPTTLVRRAVPLQLNPGEVMQ